MPDRWAARLAVQVGLGVIPFLIVPGIEEYTLLPRLLLLQACLLLPVGLWAAGRIGGDRARCPLPLLTFFLVLALSAFWSVNPYRATYDLAKVATFLMLYITVTRFLSPPDLQGLVRVHALAGLGVSLLGCAEYAGLLPAVIPSTGRPSATFGYRNLAAAYLATGIPLASILFLNARSAFDRYLGAASTTLMFVFLLYTKARASWVGLFLGVVGAWLVWIVSAPSTVLPALRSLFDRRRAVLFALCLLVAGTLILVPRGFNETHIQRLDERKTDITTTVRSIFQAGGDRGRMAMWAGTLSMIGRHPILGVGLGNWEYHYPLYDAARQIEPKFVPLRPHNDLLWIWSEEGTAGLGAFLCFVGVVIFGSRRAFRSGRMHDRFAALGLVASVIAFLGVGLFSFPWERIPPSFLFWTSAALLGSLARERRRAVDACGPGSRWLALGVLVLATLLTVQHTRFDYHFLRAYKSYLTNDTNGLVTHSARAAAIGPFDHQVLVLRGEGETRSGRPAEAERYYRRALDYSPNFANAYNAIGLARYQQKDLDGALANYRRALEIVPRHYLARYNEGIVFQEQGKLDSAIVAYRESFHTNHSKPYVNLGLVYRQMDMPDSAEAVWKKAASVATSSPEALFNLANLYLDQGRHADALDALDRFIAATGSSPQYAEEGRKSKWEALNGLGVRAEQQGDYAAAVDFYRRAADLAPEYDLAWFNLGNGLREEGDHLGAAEAYRKAIAIEPGNVDAHNNLGLALRDAGLPGEAKAAYEKALALNPRHPVVNYNLGNTLLDLQDTTGAESAYAVFGQEWQGDPALRDFYLASVYLQMGKRPEARALYERFLESGKGNVEMVETARTELERLATDGTETF